MGYCKSSWKYKRLNHLISRLQIDAISLVETQINPALLPYTYSIRNKLFKDKESATILSHNKQEHIGMRQQGGVFTGVIGQATSNTVSTGSDAEGLGRWNWIELKGSEFSTFIITAYQCVRSTQTVNTVFMQRKRHLRRCNKRGCPRQHFIADLIKFILGLMIGNNRIILAADVNEHAGEGILAKELKKIGLMNVHTKMFKQAGPASHVTGSDPIDGIWASSNLNASAVSILPHRFGAGDHRVILVDFDLDQIMERNARICRPKMRRLICENKTSVMNYNALAWMQLQFHKIPEKLKELEDSFDHMDKDRWNIRLNMIDEQITDSLIHAEKKCRKLRTGEVDYSPEVSKASEVWYTWRLALKVAEGKKHKQKELSRLMKKWGIETFDMNNKWSIKMNIEKSRREYLNIRVKQASLRKNYLETTGRKSQWKEENLKKQFKRCNSVFGKQRMKSINKVEYKEEGTLVQVVTKEDVENAIMKENSSRFRLAYSSPLLDDELCEELGLSGEGNLSKDILGSQSQLQQHPEVQEIFELFQGSKHQQITTQITTEQWIKHWERAKERTSSSYSGLHFGHYKAHTEMHAIAEIKCKLVNLAIKSGQPLKRWIKGVSVMLEKVAGNINVQKLRAILLLEADFNALHKIVFNNRLIPKLEEADAIPVEIIGGRRAQSATHLALSKKLIADTANVRKVPMITVCADATNCYDRVAHPFASLCAQYFGLEISYLVVLFRAIQSMKMFLRTSFGLSHNAYTGENGKPFQGVVQGSGAAPALWMIISIFLVRYLYNKKVTTQLSTPVSRIALPLAALMFVDDTDLYVFNSGIETTKEIVVKAQKLLDAWHNILTITGGSLKLSKCYWTLQDYQWHQGKCKMIYPTSHKLCIDLDNQREEVMHLRADQMRTLVGVPMQLNHQNDQIITSILDKTKVYQTKLLNCKLTPSDIMFGYQHYWWLSIKYPAPVLSMDHNLNVLSDLHKAMLPKLKVMRTFPIVMRSVPQFLGGLNLRRLEIEVIAQSLHHLISLYSTDTSACTLLKTLIEYHQLEVGSDKQIFSLQVEDYYDLTTPTWITTLWKNIRQFKIDLQLPPLNMGIAMQDGDMFISDIALQKNLPVDQRQAINRVRISLNLLLLSDLLVHKGNVIKHSLRQGCEDESYVSVLCWPRSEPSRKDIGIWKRFISSLCRSDGSIYINLRWTNPTQRHRKSTAFVSRDRTLIQVVHKGECRVFRQSRLSNKHTLTDMTANGCFRERVEVELQKNRCKVFGDIPLNQSPAPRRNPVLDQKDLTTWVGNYEQTCQILLSGKCLAVVDGSFFPEHPEHISAHWKFMHMRKIIGQGGFVAKVQQHLRSAYAAEVCGGLGVLSSVEKVLIRQTRHKINLTIGTDCQSAIHKFTMNQKVISFNSKLSEIVREFTRIRKEHIKKLFTEKIAGHQDEVKPRHQWSMMEHVNMQCDREAKELIREQVETSGSPNLPFILTSPILENSAKMQLTSTHMITDETHKQIAAPCIEKKLNGMVMDDIDWEFRKLITNNLSVGQQIWFSKSFTNFSGTAHQLQRQNIVQSDVCRMCNQDKERDTLHVLTCKHGLFCQCRNEKITTLQLKLIKLLDEEMLPLCLLEWMLDSRYDEIEGVPEKVMSSLRQVGRRNVWFGMLPIVFIKWVRWKYGSSKWLIDYATLTVEVLHQLWIERCNIVNECLLSKIRVEDHNNLLLRVKELCNQVEIESTSVSYQHKCRLNKVSTETLRGIACELLTNLGIESSRSSFHNDPLMHPSTKRKALTSTVLLMRDKATARRHDRANKNKKRKEEFEDMVEVESSKRRRVRRQKRTNRE